MPWDQSQAISNSVVAACLRWSADNITEPPLLVEQMGADGWEAVQSAGWQNFFASPVSQEFTSMTTFKRLMEFWSWNLNLNGNAYSLKLRTESGAFVGLLPLPYSAVDPKTNKVGTRVESYMIATSEGRKEYGPKDMVHMVRGIHPEKPALGEGVLMAAMREILTDNEISAYQRAVVQAPSPGVVITIEGADNLPDEQRKEIVERARTLYSRENAGRPMVLSGEAKVQSAGFSPAEMDIGKMSLLPETRITADFGIPAMILGFMSGNNQATYANYDAALEAAATNHLDPLWTVMEETLTMQLLPEVDSTANRRVRFDRSKVKALQENTDAMYKRVSDLFKANIIDRATTLRELGMQPQPTDENVYSWQLSPQSAGVLPPAEGRSARQRHGAQ